MIVTFRSHEPGGGSVIRTRENLHNIVIEKSQLGTGPYVFADTDLTARFNLPAVIVCKPLDLVSIKEE